MKLFKFRGYQAYNNNSASFVFAMVYCFWFAVGDIDMLNSEESFQDFVNQLKC